MNKRGWLITVLLAMWAIVPGAWAEEEASGPNVQYVDIKPSFVANFGEPSKKLKFAKIDVSVRVGSVADANLVESHFPLIRNEFVLLVSRQSEAAMSSMDGQEKLRQEALEAFRKKLKEEVGRNVIDDLLFTNFVVQH